MLKKNTEDTRFDTTPTDTRLTVRTNLDVKVTESTLLKAGIVGRLKEFRGTRYGRSAIFNKKNLWHSIRCIPPFAMRMAFMEVVLRTGTGNPVALLKDYGHIRNVYTEHYLADLSIRQDLSALTKAGLAAEASVSFR